MSVVKLWVVKYDSILHSTFLCAADTTTGYEFTCLNANLQSIVLHFGNLHLLNFIRSIKA